MMNYEEGITDKHKTSDYSDAYTLVKGTINVAKETDAAPNNEKAIIKNCLFTNCISRKSDAKAYDAQDVDVVISMIYDL